MAGELELLQQAREQVLELVERGPFLSAGGVDAAAARALPPHQLVETAEAALGKLLGEGEAREAARIAITRAAVAAGGRPLLIEQEAELSYALEPLVERRLPAALADAIEDVVGDLVWWILGRAFAVPTLLDTAFVAYTAGLLPVGSHGEMLLVYAPGTVRRS